jgi:hypothetical protein
MRSMDSIVVVNAGFSSVKFEVFAVDGPAKLTRKIKGRWTSYRGDPSARFHRKRKLRRSCPCPGAKWQSGEFAGSPSNLASTALSSSS